MGLFGNLFEKKVCDICGGEIGLFGNRKLEDGNCCKECAKKLSPWFSDRRSSTVAEIKEQLQYREENKSAVAAFHVTRAIGDNMKVLLDEDAGKLMVTSARDLAEANPDVLDFSQVTGCDLSIRESQSEVYRQVKDREGNTKRESYYPRRYRYRYSFRMIINVNHPYFDSIEYDLASSVEVEPRREPSFGRYGGVRAEGSTTPPTLSERRSDVEYAGYEQMGMEIKDALTKMRVNTRENAEAAKAPRMAVICPWCGATTKPDANGCCEYCGGSLSQQ